MGNTLDGWLRKTVELLRLLYDLLVEEVFAYSYLQADETTVPIMNQEKHKTEKKYLWMVRAVMGKLVIFHYDNGLRAGSVIETLVGQYHFKGYFLCYDFVGYETAFKPHPDVWLVNCLAHIRRHFELALDENREMAQYALTQIGHVYQIELRCDEVGLTYDGRREKRQVQSRLSDR